MTKRGFYRTGLLIRLTDVFDAKDAMYRSMREFPRIKFLIPSLALADLLFFITAGQLIEGGKA